MGHAQVNKPRTQHIKVLDVVRGLAAVCVFVSHYVQQFMDVPGMGWSGVALELLGVVGVATFFVLSGFLIHSGALIEHQREGRVSWRAYAIKRFFRIYPAYIVALMACTLLSRHWQSNMISEATTASWLSHALLYSSFIPGHFEAINAIFWTVIVECHFYLMYPLLWALRRQWSLALLLLAALMTGLGFFALSTVLSSPGEVRVMLQHTALALFWQWCLGVALAEIWVHDWFARLRRRWLEPRWLLWPLLVALFIGTMWGKASFVELQYKRFAVPVLCMGLVALALFSHWSQARSRLGEWLGDVSYSVYLWHPIALLIALHVNVSGGAIALVAVALTLLMAGLSHYFIERPGLRMGRQLLAMTA